MHTVFKKVSRFLILGLCFWMPAERKIRLERWLRGREDQWRSWLTSPAECAAQQLGVAGMSRCASCVGVRYDAASRDRADEGAEPVQVARAPHVRAREREINR